MVRAQSLTKASLALSLVIEEKATHHNTLLQSTTMIEASAFTQKQSCSNRDKTINSESWLMSRAIWSDTSLGATTMQLQALSRTNFQLNLSVLARSQEKAGAKVPTSWKPMSTWSYRKTWLTRKGAATDRFRTAKTWWVPLSLSWSVIQYQKRNHLLATTRTYQTTQMRHLKVKTSWSILFKWQLLTCITRNRAVGKSNLI